MSRPWTAISYNWSAGKTTKIIFHGSHEANSAKQEFEIQYPGEDLVALVPGSHEYTATYPLDNFSGAIKHDD